LKRAFSSACTAPKETFLNAALQKQATAIADGYAAKAEPRAFLTYQDAKRIGRPTTLTTELIDAFGELLADGMYPETARKCLGIPHRTFYNWVDRAKHDAAEDLDTAEAAFWHTYEKAEGWGEVELIREAKSGKLGWQGPMTVASRRFRAHWQDKEAEYGGPKVQVIIGAIDGDVNIGVQQVNVIANYQTQTDTEGTTLQPLTATPIDVSPSESEGRKLTAQAKVSRRVSRGGRRGARSGGGP
jgi:hypothetical protein